MPATRRHFGCGHFGFGAYCHRCRQASALEQEIEKSKAQLLQRKDLDKAKQEAAKASLRGMQAQLENLHKPWVPKAKRAAPAPSAPAQIKGDPDLLVTQG